MPQIKNTNKILNLIALSVTIGSKYRKHKIFRSQILNPPIIQSVTVLEIFPNKLSPKKECFY